jgi:hypothetical protein
MGVRRFARRRENAFGRAVEGRAHRGEILDARPRLARHAERDVRIDDAATGRDCIACVVFRRIAFFHSGCNAALRPP